MIVDICWISTGLYNKRWDKFYKSCQRNFLPGVTKVYHIYSDDLLWFGPYTKYTVTNKIEHLYWPLVTLFKPKRVENTCDSAIGKYVFYFNSNIEFREPITEQEILFKDALSVAHNPAWWSEGCDPNRFTYGKPIDPKFTCHIDGHYEYLQAAMYGGPVKLMKQLSVAQLKGIEYDLAHRRIPCWDDESYFNWWCNNHKDKINILPREYLMDDLRKIEPGFDCPDPKIVMTDSSDTQYEYKDRHFENVRSN